jgi:DNA-binding GntR family transcriptional regulator
VSTTLLQNQGLETHYVSLSQEIRNLLLEAFIEGDLAPGTRVNDIELAKKLGVSRTPVREALRGLQSLGIIETLPARITRVATLTSEEMAHAQTVWVSLYRVLLSEVLHKVNHSHVSQMTKFQDEYAKTSGEKLATLSFRLFSSLVPLTDNSFLRESINASAYRMRLGFSNLLEHTHFQIGVRDAQIKFVAAITDGHLRRACEALEMMTSVKLPHQLDKTTESCDLPSAKAASWDLTGRNVTSATAAIAG